MTDSKQHALSMIDHQISEYLQLARSISSVCGLGELFFLCHYLHVVRAMQADDFSSGGLANKILAQLLAGAIIDTLKYSMQLVVKLGSKAFNKNTESGLLIDSQKCSHLIETVTKINSAFETRYLLTLFEKVEVVNGKRLAVHLDSGFGDTRRNKFFEYFHRLDRNNQKKKSNLRTIQTTLEDFLAEYGPVSDLLEAETGLSAKDFASSIDELLNLLIENLKTNENKMSLLDNGNIDTDSHQTILAVSSSFVISKTFLTSNKAHLVPLLESLKFDSSTFDESQLKFPLVARTPIFSLGSAYLVSPELLVDSLFINTHYSLLESTKSKNKYKARYSQLFLDKITKIAAKFGYSEFGRDIDLFEGRKQIGDIDLVLESSEGQWLIIEAKSYSLPLEVYPHNYASCEDRLATLQSDWEVKVKKRLRHLETAKESYGITGPFVYLIVSKLPEILSHFSDLLVLAIDEFEYWLESKQRHPVSMDLFKDYYDFESEFMSRQ